VRQERQQRHRVCWRTSNPQHRHEHAWRPWRSWRSWNRLGAENLGSRYGPLSAHRARADKKIRLPPSPCGRPV